MKRFAILALSAAWVLAPSVARAACRFQIVDPTTSKPVSGTIDVYQGGVLVWSVDTDGSAPTNWIPFGTTKATYVVPVGESFRLQQGPPVKDITIVVRASRIPRPAPPAGASGVTRDAKQIQTFGGTAAKSDPNALVRGQSGVAEDSAGQAHIRGEHAEIAYVIDGVPLPDTLSGRQGSIVVSSTVQRVNLLTGGFAPEFGGDTAAILDITTLPGARKLKGESSIDGGSYSAYDGDLTLQGPFGAHLSYVFDFQLDTTQVGEEPQQPNNDDAHNASFSRSLFTSLKWNPSKSDAVALTLSNSPYARQVSNRTGLDDGYAVVGEGFGFLGLRDRDGTRPDAAGSGVLGAAPMLLPSQAAAGMDIDSDEINEFGTLSYNHRFTASTRSLVAVTVLHSGSSLWNRNPAVDPLNLPVDNSIEFDPTVTRNVHQSQAMASLTSKAGRHEFKFGALYDEQSGNESYNIQPASKLALDELAALDPSLAPQGSASSALDVDGNPVYTATGGSPTLLVHRSGYYAAAYGQDTWKEGRLTTNYGVRLDWYKQSENLGQAPVSTFNVSPRLNFQYKFDKKTEARASFNRLLDLPPLAQGAVVGAAIQPETISQYDAGVTQQLGRGVSFEAAYYYKDIRNQVDTGLLVPGSDMGLYSAVNFQRGAVHGLELSLDLTPAHKFGWDGYLNYSHSAAAPEGLDSTGAPAPTFNDHDQRDTVGAGLAYTWKSGATLAATLEYGSGLASSVLTDSSPRVPRYEVDLHYSSGEIWLRHHVGFTVDVENLTNQLTVINFESGFSGTRFMEGRRIQVGLEMKF